MTDQDTNRTEELLEHRIREKLRSSIMSRVNQVIAILTLAFAAVTYFGVSEKLGQ